MSNTTTFNVQGMTCGHCVSAVTQELSAIDGVESVDIDLVAGGDSPVTVTSQAPVDALLVLSFGGPEGPDEVRPFLENVVRGRGVPPERTWTASIAAAALGRRETLPRRRNVGLRWNDEKRNWRGPLTPL